MGRGAHIVQVASAAAFVPLPHMNVYAATKAFVLRYTRALRWELHGTGITATALCPTWVKTGFEKVARESGGAQDVRHPSGRPEGLDRRVPCPHRKQAAPSSRNGKPAIMRLAHHRKNRPQLHQYGRLGAHTSNLGALTSTTCP